MKLQITAELQKKSLGSVMDHKLIMDLCVKFSKRKKKEGKPEVYYKRVICDRR